MRIISKTTALGVVVILLGIALPAAVVAQDGTDKLSEETIRQKTEQTAKAKETAREAKAQLTQTAKERREAMKERLEGRKLKACQNREKAVTNIMVRIADRGQKQVDLFTKIADRTQQFYADKGLSANSYDELVADVNAKKAAAQSAVDSVKSTSVEFKCDGDNPRGVADSFKQSKNDQNLALKAYKTAVKDLIVGVKSANGQGGEQ